MALDPGLYEKLISEAIARDVEASGLDLEIASLDVDEAHLWLSRYIDRVVRRAVRSLPSDRRSDMGARLINNVIELVAAEAGRAGLSSDDALRLPPEMLLSARRPGDDLMARPLTPLSETALLTNAPGEPSMGSEIGREFASADSVDALVAFVRWGGVRLIERELRDFLLAGKRLRLITTTYTGSTERTALDRLVGMGAEIKVSYDTRSTRLHAKAWLFSRNSEMDTAWIGSSNLTSWALVDGLEWNVRVSGAVNPEVIEKVRSTFDHYWSDPHFESYDPERDAQRFDEAVESVVETPTIDLALIDVRPYPFQVEMLDRLDAERKRHNRWRNLVVAATGTGKTIVSALDYRRLREESGDLSLLFVAHRREILLQSLSTFRTVLRDGSFGETYVDGHSPQDWRHVFASVQSLTSLDPTTIDPSHFDVIIVDEFHHAAARTYQTLLDHVSPKVLLGLTATPERADGQSVTKWFDDRIAVELRLWDALDLGLLVPFHYFGIHDDVPLDQVTWSRGGYQLSELENLYTGNDARVAKVVQALRDKVTDIGSMRALGFCVSVAHAEFMARRFNDVGIPSVAVSASTSMNDRDDALRRLRSGELNCVFAVDLFNEGIDIPDIDTVLMLRPTESATVFLQQLGRGLRHAQGKACLTVLDFVGQQHRSFRFDLKYRAITGADRTTCIGEIEGGFPYLPAGCHMDLDPVARRIVLDHIRLTLPTTWPKRVEELRRLGDVSLSDYLAATGLELEDVYTGNRGWTALRRTAGLRVPLPGPHEDRLQRALGRMLHIDDLSRVTTYSDALARPEPPSALAPGSSSWRLLFMLHLDLWGTGSDPISLDEGFRRLWGEAAILSELRELLVLLDMHAEYTNPDHQLGIPAPFELHARYTRDEVLAAMAIGTPERPMQLREGVRWDAASETDLFFVTLDKSDRAFSPSTRYADYAISPELFHWESQSGTTVASPTGQRYLNQRENGTRVLLFVREDKQTAGGSTRPFTYLGPAQFVDHRSERPIAITWRLGHPMPPSLYRHAKAAAG